MNATIHSLLRAIWFVLFCTFVAAGDFKALESLPRSSASGLIVVVYAAKSGKFAMAQTLEYVPHEYRPVSDLHLFEVGKFTMADFMA